MNISTGKNTSTNTNTNTNLLESSLIWRGAARLTQTPRPSNWSAHPPWSVHLGDWGWSSNWFWMINNLNNCTQGNPIQKKHPRLRNTQTGSKSSAVLQDQACLNKSLSGSEQIMIRIWTTKGQGLKYQSLLYSSNTGYLNKTVMVFSYKLRWANLGRGHPWPPAIISLNPNPASGGRILL